MSKNTRYDKLREKLKTEFSRSRTYAPDVSAGSTSLVFDLADPENIGNDSHLAAGPFNYVSVRNTSADTVRVYLRNDLEVFVDVSPPSGSGANRVVATERIPLRYVSYLRVENTGTADIADGELTIQVGNEVDGIEMDLLEMSGLLNIDTEA